MKGQTLWNKAKKLIPGGGQLLSKRCEMFLPDHWPAYYEKAKGCEVWDMDGNHFYDFAQMGVGSCTLGYADRDVNNAVIEAVKKSSMCSLNSYEEVALAERLLELHPWAQMCRFPRTGGEACATAIRIARAATGKDKVCFCGYHGWHDWYISANLADSNALDDQLLPGLSSKGIPRGLANTVLPFPYNDAEALEKIIEMHPGEIGTIIMEPQRGHEPEPGFLEKIRGLATKYDIVLIFDEVTSGFRMNLGGIHLTYKVEPDLAIFGKALGNGFPIAAVIGRKKVMDVCNESFISSTMWTERIGFVAALTTLEKMKKLNVQNDLVRYGEMLFSGWRECASRHGLNIQTSGIPPLAHLSFEYNNHLAIQTYYTQEMLKKGYLLGASVYTTHAYSPKIIGRFIAATDEVFYNIGKALKKGNLERKLEGGVKHSGFKRLT